MNLKKEYLKIKSLDEMTSNQKVMFYNELDWKDEEVLNHYRFLTKDINYEKVDRYLKEERERGFEVVWLLRKDKNS